jgi:hypothetical protein
MAPDSERIERSSSPGTGSLPPHLEHPHKPPAGLAAATSQSPTHPLTPLPPPSAPLSHKRRASLNSTQLALIETFEGSVLDLAPNGDVLIQVDTGENAIILRALGSVLEKASSFFRKAFQSKLQEATSQIFMWPDDKKDEVELFLKIIHCEEIDYRSITAPVILRLAYLCDRICERPPTVVQGIVRLWAGPLISWLKTEVDIDLYHRLKAYKPLLGLGMMQSNVVSIDQFMEIALIFDDRQLLRLLCRAFVLETVPYSNPMPSARLPLRADGRVLYGE